MTGKTGIADLLPKDSFYPYWLHPCSGIPQSQYLLVYKNQNWLQIDTKELGETLLAVYNNPHEAKERGLRAQQFIKDNFNYFSVGKR